MSALAARTGKQRCFGVQYAVCVLKRRGSDLPVTRGGLRGWHPRERWLRAASLSPQPAPTTPAQYARPRGTATMARNENRERTRTNRSDRSLPLSRAYRGCQSAPRSRVSSPEKHRRRQAAHRWRRAVCAPHLDHGNAHPPKKSAKGASTTGGRLDAQQGVQLDVQQGARLDVQQGVRLDVKQGGRLDVQLDAQLDVQKIHPLRLITYPLERHHELSDVPTQLQQDGDSQLTLDEGYHPE